MNPTEVLKHEHRIIEQMLDCLEKIAAEARMLGRLQAEPARDAVEFLRDFADRCHHGKEEAHLFPALEAKGFPREGGPTGAMLTEHEQGREHIRNMGAAIERAATGDAEAVDDFCTHAEGYAELLRRHIAKEDNVLFRLADQVLSPGEQSQLMEQFEHVESEHMGAGTHGRLLDLADRLADRYGVAKAEHATVHSCGCRHH
jgi:hemerythrin-like domain-containing protein